MLQDFFKVKVSTIHGDLNLENILVDPDTRHLSLIDFVTARQGHALHDLLRLETEVVTKLVSAALAEANLSLDVLQTLYEQLHRVIFYPRQYSSQEYPHPALAKAWAMLVAIRKMARKCLFDPDDWREYYCGLTLYMLGALKFKNLDQLPTAPLPKQAAFWAAATVVALLD
jgi:aminoglycoside phosphotransferase (APT) family kinase protein